MKNTQDLGKLSDSELDDLIMQGINGQEQSWKHSEEYQHHLNVVAKAKEEKARREASGSTGKGADIPAVAENIKDDKVQDMSGGKTSEIKSPKSKEKAVGDTPIRPKSDDNEIPAENINTGMPGVVAGMAEETPENVPHVGKDIKA